MKNRLFFILLCAAINLYSQNVPTVTLKDSSQLKLTSLKIDVQITGNFATTTYDMQFYNALDRTLEGELAFPLGQGQSVSRFAMDVNGKLREAVIVEKELARVAFESTVRRNIDPGLLEKTEGNNYKARVYPILAKAYKHIVIAYEQELFTTDNFQTFELPLRINEKLEEFSINIIIFGGEGIPIIKNNKNQQFFFREKDNVYRASLSKTNHIPNKPIIVQIPNSLNHEKILSYQDYFYVYKRLHPKSRLKTKPKKIVILWDVSYSLKYRNLEEELTLLKQYISYLQHVEVQFISFSNRIHQNKTLLLNQDNWGALEQLIRATNYDGGTSLNVFSGLKLKADETLLFTDGLANLGNFSAYNKRAIYTINSTVSANHEALNAIATHSGGNYINLVRSSSTEAMKVLKQETYQFLGVNHNNAITEVYPFKNTNVSADFSISGRFSEDTTIELLFGYRGKVTERMQVSVKKSEGTKLVKRLWAKQKLTFLNENKEQNKRAIISLSKQYHLITDYTSMLILDRVEDYARYRIEPPQELKQQYKVLIKNIEVTEAAKREALKYKKEDLFDEYDDIIDWYNTNYPTKKHKKLKKILSGSANQNGAQVQNNQSSSNTTVISNNQNQNSEEEVRAIELDTAKRIISGTVLDENQQPLPGVNVHVQGTANGTSTDFDGNYSINAEENDVLEFSYIGFDTKNLTVRDSSTINISLNENPSILEEVVIIAQGVQTKRKSIGYSVTSIASESLSGKSSGVNITSQSGASSSVTVRGINSISSNSQPLYIVDGVPVIGSPTAGNSTTLLKPEDIDAIQVLKGENGVKLYGSRAANGIVIITTKKGKETNQEAIQELDERISEEIELKSWNPDTPYIKILEKEPTVETAYKRYLEIRDTYANSPSFYLDVADFFDKKEQPQTAITILTNLMEVELDNYELIKALAYKLEYFGQYNLAVIAYKKVLELRPEDPQSYRDLALAYEQNGEIQKSFDLLYMMYNGELLEKDQEERYYGIEHIAFVELTRLVAKYKKKLKLTKAQKNSFAEIPVDVRVVIDWNHNDTDIDLWVFDPHEEKAWFKNTKTEIGGRMSEDLTEGYGPEEFMLKKAVRGNYKIMVDYYADNVQKISGPTILKVTLYTNYGRKNEQKKIIIVRLDKEEDEIEIGNLKF